MSLLLEACALSHVYPDGSVGLDGCSLAIRSGSRNALLGSNGSGKTSLLLHFNALLINTARGGLVNEQALADALRSGHLGGAACDVLSSEPPQADNPLLAGDIPRLIITPHCAWGSREARQRIVGQLAENAHAYFNAAPRRLIN